jgi:hypothetical protein
MNLLFVEDDDAKAEKISHEVGRLEPEFCLRRAKSFTSALREMVKEKNSISGVILDMSMPNFDNSQEAPENFAGRDFLQQCKLRRIERPTIVVTMLDLFGSGVAQLTLEQLDRQLAAAFSPMYLGIVYFSSAQEAWKSELGSLLAKLRTRIETPCR